MKKKKQKGYWEKLTEKYSKGVEAKARVAELRAHEHVSHVTVEKNGNEYIVSFSVAKWYLDELRRAGIKL